MKLTEFMQAQVPAENKFSRAREIDLSGLDSFIVIETRSGKEKKLRTWNCKGAVHTANELSFDDDDVLVFAGTSFWNPSLRTTQVIGIDVDSIAGHAEGVGVANEVLEALLIKLSAIQWLEVRRSSGGNGLHIFVFFSSPVHVVSRSEMTLLANAVIQLIATLVDCDLHSVKDMAGGIFWLYKKDAPSNAYEVLSAATSSLDPAELPADWNVAKAKKRKPKTTSNSTQTTRDNLDADHQRILSSLRSKGFAFVEDDNHDTFHTHTVALQQLAESGECKGLFKTVSAGNDPGQPNAFMRPLPGGAFLVSRFGSAKEDRTWFESPKGSYCYLNAYCPFDKAARHFSQNNTSRGFAFNYANLQLFLGATGVPLSVPATFEGRTFFVVESKGELRVSVEATPKDDDSVGGWTRTGKNWCCSGWLPDLSELTEAANHALIEDVVRAVHEGEESTSWYVKSHGEWTKTSPGEVNNVCTSYGLPAKAIMGKLRSTPHRLVYRPFEIEYPGEYLWNRNAPQYACVPAKTPAPTPAWDAMFTHIGSGIDEDILQDSYCQKNHITTGSHFLMLWVAILLRYASQRLPYLLLTSKENVTGKTTFGRAMKYLIKPGVMEINEEALAGTFNGELSGKVLCLIEELDLQTPSKKSYQTLKRILTSDELSIRKMRTDTFTVDNFTHFIHTTNDARFVPCDKQDQRVIMIPVSPLPAIVPSDQFQAALKEEAPSMLARLLEMPLPPTDGRFWIPVVHTALKDSVLAGTYEMELTEGEKSVKSFALKCLQPCEHGRAHLSRTLAAYREYCAERGLRQIHKAGFLPALQASGHPGVQVRQGREDGRPTRFYYGITLHDDIGGEACVTPQSIISCQVHDPTAHLALGV